MSETVRHNLGTQEEGQDVMEDREPEMGGGGKGEEEGGGGEGGGRESWGGGRGVSSSLSPSPPRSFEEDKEKVREEEEEGLGLDEEEEEDEEREEEEEFVDARGADIARFQRYCMRNRYRAVPARSKTVAGTQLAKHGEFVRPSTLAGKIKKKVH
jgi:hypothetical protein